MGWLRDWFDNREEEARQRHRARVGELLEMFEQIPTGRALLETVKDKKLHISFHSDVDGHASTINSRLIRLHPKTPDALQPIYLAHEIRHVWQDKEGLIMRRKTDVLDNLVSSRFAEADAFAIEVQIAWELTEHNVLPEAWNVYSRKNREFAKVAEVAVTRNKGAAKNGNMMRTVFNKWFQTSYKNSYDFSSIQDSRSQLERRAQGRAATQEFDRKRPEGAPERMSSAFLQEFGRVSGVCDYLSGVNTKSTRYTGDISTANKKRIQRLHETHAL